MREIHWVQLDKVRPAVILTRQAVLPRIGRVTVAPITSRIRGLISEVPVGTAHGLQHNSVISCDNIATVATTAVQGRIGWLSDEDEEALTEAIHAAFDLT